jgi:hypothetical protein
MDGRRDLMFLKSGTDRIARFSRIKSHDVNFLFLQERDGLADLRFLWPVHRQISSNVAARLRTTNTHLAEDTSNCKSHADDKDRPVEYHPCIPIHGHPSFS